MYNFLKDFLTKNKFYYFLIFLTKSRLILISLVLPHFYGKLITNLKDKKLENIKYLFGYLVFFWILSQVLSNIQSYIETFLTPQFYTYVRTKLLKLIINKHKYEYKDLETGRFITQINNSPWILLEGMERVSKFLTDNIFKITSTFCYFFYYDEFVGLAFLVCMLLICILTYIYIKVCNNLVYESTTEYVNLNEYIDDTVSNLLSIYSVNKDKQEFNNFIKKNKKNEKLDTKIELYDLGFRIVYSISFIIFFVVINYLSIYLFIKNRFNISILVAIIIINYGLLNEFMYLLYNIKSIIHSLGRINAFSDYLESIDSNYIEVSKDNKLDLEKINFTHKIFENNFVNVEIINLNYKIRNKTILKNINLKIKRKENIVLTGDIGSGKSTLCKIIFGLIKNQSGEIKFNGVSKKLLDENTFRNYVTYIPQHPKLFNRSLFENITYDSKNINVNKIYQLLDDLQLYDLKKIYTDIMYKSCGKNGSNLSGGQRQIVWLLRSIFKNNKMIILDEPTSSLDRNTKIKVMKLIKKLTETKNIIIITHDNELFDFMDRIIFLKKGKINYNKNISNVKKI